MKIAVLGTGVVGQTIAEKLYSLGHQVIIGTRSKSDTLVKSKPDSFGRLAFKDWLSQHSEIQFGPYEEAAAFGEIIVNATNGGGTLASLEQAGEKNLSGKVMLDIANPLDFSQGMPPSLLVCNTDSLGEQIQRAYPGVKVVKSLNTLSAYLMVNPGLLQEDTTIFLNGNDADAKKQVRTLLNSFGWKDDCIIDMGDISTARGTEMLLPIWVRLWGALQNPLFNFKIVVGQQPSK